MSSRFELFYKSTELLHGVKDWPVRRSRGYHDVARGSKRITPKDLMATTHILKTWWLAISIASVACSSGSSGSAAVDGGSETGASVTTDTCSATHDCMCPAGGNCVFTCVGSDTCNATCDGASICKVKCGSGACSLTCGQDSACQQLCGSGACTGSGLTADSVSQTCGSGTCDLQCTDVANCKQATGSGAHNCSGCD